MSHRRPTAASPFAVSVLLASSLLLAAESDVLLSTYQREEALRAEILSAQGAWRAPEEETQAWRAPPEPARTQARFGYDPAYDDMQAQLHLDDHPGTRGLTLHEPQPATLLRVQF